MLFFDLGEFCTATLIIIRPKVNCLCLKLNGIYKRHQHVEYINFIPLFGSLTANNTHTHIHKHPELINVTPSQMHSRYNQMANKLVCRCEWELKLCGEISFPQRKWLIYWTKNTIRRPHRQGRVYSAPTVSTLDFDKCVC